MTTHPSAEKILIVTDTTAGISLVSHLALTGTPWSNLRVLSALDLARSWVEGDLVREGLEPASPTATVLVVEEALEDLARDSRSFFAGIPLTPGFVSMAHATVQDLRMAGLRPEDLRPEALESERKAWSLRALLRAYEDGLSRRRLVDRADILRRAVASLESGSVQVPSDTRFLVPAWLPVGRGLVRRFLEALPQDQVVVLARDPVYGLSPTPDHWPQPSGPADPGPEPAAAQAKQEAQPAAEAVPSDVLRLPYLFAVDRSPPPVGDDTVRLFRAAGRHNEIRHVLRDLLGSGVPLDQAELVITDEDYLGAVADVTEHLRIPCTFATGLPALDTRPGRALGAYLEWVGGGFLVTPLWTALAEGLLQVPDPGEHSGLAFARVLRSSRVGWGRERLLRVLAEDRSAAERRLAERDAQPTGPTDDAAPESPEQVRENLRARIDMLTRLEAFAQVLVSTVPEPDADGCVELSALARGAAQVLAQLAAVAGPVDEEARRALQRTLDDIARAASKRYPLQEAVERLRHLLGGVRVGASGPRPGHLHVTGTAAAGWSGRRHVYLVGLDQDRFPGVGSPDPLLLDEERAALDPGVSLRAERPARRRFDLAAALAGLRGRLTASYTVHDPASDRAGAPSPVLLQLHRLCTGDPDRDFSDLIRALGQPVGYVPAVDAAPTRGVTPLPLDAHDWWLGRLVLPDGRRAPGRDAVLSAYPRLRQGWEAVAARSSEALSAYDGWVGPDPALDPRDRPEVVLSASRLETLALCPLKYFYQYVLRLRPPDEVVYDPGRWLDASQHGQLLHDVFRDFLQGLRNEGIERPEPHHRDRLMRVLERHIERWRQQVPPPSEQVFLLESAALRRSAELFLRAETSEPPEEMARFWPVAPRFFELTFGFGNGNHPEPVRIPTASGRTIHLRGRIDRIDAVGPSDYLVWDYKTGSPADFDGQAEFEQGRRIQHALYAQAAEAILRRQGHDTKARVVGAGYYFATERGEGQRRLYPQDEHRRRALAEILDLLAEVARQGLFIPAKDSAVCRSCDFRDGCGAERAVRQIQEKRGAAEQLTLLRRLQRYG